MKSIVDDLPPNNNLIKHASPQSSDDRAELRLSLTRIIIQQIPHSIIHSQLRFISGILIVLKSIKPKAKYDHEIQATKRMLHTPIRSAGSANPFDTL